MGPGMFDGLGTFILILIIGSVFGVWKLIELAVWIFNHVRIGVV